MKNLFLCFSLCLIACLGFAQTKPNVAESGSDSKIYVKIYGSYGLPTPGSYRYFDANPSGFPILYGGFNTTPSGTNLTYQNTSSGLGQGFHLGGGIGLVISDFINLGIDGDYYSSGQITAVSVLDEFIFGTDALSTSNIKASMVTILPNITFKALSKPSSYMYMRLGIGAGIPTIKQDYVNTLKGATSSSKEFTFNGSLAWGYLVSLGVQKRITPNIRAFAEIQLINFSYSPQEREITTWLEDDDDNPNTPLKDVLASKKPSETKIEYYDEYTTTLNAQQKEDKPVKSVRLTMPIASLGLQIGLVYRF